MGLQEAIQNIWSSDYVQKNPNKAYKASYASEYNAVAAYLNGGAEPDWSGYSKMGKGLCEAEHERRAAAIPEPPPVEPPPVEPPPVVTPPPPTGVTPTFAADFETGDFSEIENNQYTVHGQWTTQKITIIPAAAMHGSLGVRVSIGTADAGNLYAASPPRGEMVICSLGNGYASQSQNKQAFPWASPAGHHTWMTWYAKFNSPWDHGGSSSWCLTCQVNGPSGTYNPCFALNTVGPSPGIMYLTVRGGAVNPDANATARTVQIMKPTPVDTLLKIKVHHLWSTGGDGLTEIYINNALKGSIAGANMYSGYESQLYQKLGIYRTASGLGSSDSVLHIDNIRHFTSDPGDL